MKQTPLNQSLELSRHMLELVKQGAWDEAAELEQVRQRLIEEELQAASSLAIKDKVEALREIQRLNQQAEAIGRKERSELSKQLRELKQGRKVTQAYRKNA
ncbi:MAG: flagellar protein FliT [Gammaproteobacteria bacterium]|nr:flagellar protein FliT [Gammaproteobacteria bacterium]